MVLNVRVESKMYGFQPFRQVFDAAELSGFSECQ